MKQREIETLGTTALQAAEKTAITTPELYENAGGILQTLRELKDQAKKIIDPLLVAVRVSNKEAKAVEKALLGPILEAESIIKNKMKEVDFDPPETPGVQVRRNTSFEIVDAELLPRTLMSPDAGKIRKLVTAVGLGAQIPGVRIFEQKTIAITKVKS